MAKAVPEGYHTLTPYFTVADGERFITFLQKGFGAEITNRHNEPGGRLKNAEMRLGTSMLMVGQASEGWPSRPQTLYLYVENADTLFARAVSAGANILRPMQDMYYGDRCGGLVDGEGNQWWIATRKEDLSDEELDRRGGAHGK